MSDNIGKKLRELRKNKGYTVEEVSKHLISKGFKASIKTIYSWENGNSEPTTDALLTLCELYKVSNVLTEFGYEQTVPSVTSYEFDYVQKIRLLDRFGHIAVMDTIEREFLRCQEQTMEKATTNMYDYYYKDGEVLIENPKFSINKKERSPYNHEE